MILVASKFRICKVTSLLTIVIFSLHAPALFQINDIRFNRLSIDDGLSNSYITCILQDHKGFMWFGTQDGLNKYDGYNFTIYKHDPSNSNSISDNYVRSIVEVEDSIIWIGTESGGLNRFNPATETFTHYRHDPDNPNSLSHNSVRVINGESAILWIGTNGGGLNRFDRETETFKHYTEKDGLSNDVIYGILEDGNGNILDIMQMNG